MGNAATSEEQFAASAAVGANKMNAIANTAGRKRGDPLLERAVRHNQFLRKDAAMRSRSDRGAGKDTVEGASENAVNRKADAAYDEAVEVGYEGDISSRYMKQFTGDTSNTNVKSVMTDSEKKLGDAVFQADVRAKKEHKAARSTVPAQQDRPQPARPTGPSHIEAHGYNGPIYGGGMGNRTGGGIGMGGPVDPESGMAHMNVDDPRRLHSHNVTGGGGTGNPPSDVGNNGSFLDNWLQGQPQGRREAMENSITNAFHSGGRFAMFTGSENDQVKRNEWRAAQEVARGLGYDLSDPTYSQDAGTFVGSLAPRRNNGAGDHRYAREHTTNEQWDSGEQIPNEAPPLPTDDWITGGNPLAGGNGNNGGNPPNNNPPPGGNGGTPTATPPDDDGRPRRRNNGRTYLPQRRDIGTGYQHRAMQIMGSSENYEAWLDGQPDNQEARSAYDLWTRNTFLQAAALPEE